MSKEFLRRYTDVPALIYFLRERKITLLDPQSWDDSNDSHYLTLYREKNRLRSVLALCFTQTSETYHHWRVFSGGPSGVCIRFKRSQFLNALKEQDGIRSGPVAYLRLPQIREAHVATDDLPFLKRYAFEHEEEYRVIYQSGTKKKVKLDIKMPLSCIDKITLSPWIHPALYPHLKRTLRSINGCSTLDIVRSTLIGNEEWKRLGENST